MKLELINETLIVEANWYKKKKYENVIDLLKDFAEDHIDDLDDWFISFTSIDKLGLNPKSRYKTPLGIYAYPLRYVIDHDFVEDLPFVGDQPFINLFSIAEDARTLNTDDDDSISNSYMNRFANKHPDYKADLSEYQIRSGISELWLTTRQFAKKDPKKWNHVLRSIGLHGVIDGGGTSTIHPSEPTQAVFFSTSVIDKTIRLLNRNIKRESDRKSEKGKKIKIRKDEIKYTTTSNRELALKKFNNLMGVNIRNGDADGITNLMDDITDSKYEGILKDNSIPRSIIENMVRYGKLELIEHILDTFIKYKRIIGPYNVNRHIHNLSSMAYKHGAYQIIDKIISITQGNIYHYVSIEHMINDYDGDYGFDDKKDSNRKQAFIEMFERYISDQEYMKAYSNRNWIEKFKNITYNYKRNDGNPLRLRLKKYLEDNNLGYESTNDDQPDIVHQYARDFDRILSSAGPGNIFISIMKDMKDYYPDIINNHHIEHAISRGLASNESLDMDKILSISKICEEHGMDIGVIAYAPFIIRNDLESFTNMTSAIGVVPSSKLVKYINEFTNGNLKDDFSSWIDYYNPK